MHNITIVSRISNLPRYVEKLPNVNKVISADVSNKNDIATKVKSSQILIGDPPLVAPYVADAPQLKWLQSTWAGVDAVFRVYKEKQEQQNQVSLRPHFVITRSGGTVFGQIMSEYVLMQILARERRFIELNQAQQNKEWAQRSIGYGYRSLEGKVATILGVGSIGRHIAKTLKFFHVTVQGMVNNVDKLRTWNEANGTPVDKIYKMEEIDECLAESDYIINVLPSTAKTKGLLSNNTLSVCKKNALLINVGRGDVIDEDSILRALNEKWISGAVLDVFSEEPLPSSSPLWHVPGVTITPHCAAVSMEKDIFTVVKDNFKLYHEQTSNGNETLNLIDTVNWDAGY